MHLMRHPLIALLALLAVTLSQQPSSQQQPGVTFRVEVNFVEIDAVVTDAQGHFVRDLTRDDFELLEEGQPQSVAAFTLVDLPVRKADPPLSRTAPIEPDVRTNLEAFNGRVILIVLDDLQTDARRSAPVRAAAAQFVRRFVAANDLVAVVYTGSGAKAGQEFTNSQARLLAAIDRFSGQKIPSSAMMAIDDFYKGRSVEMAGRNSRDSMDAERAHKARNSLSTLRAASEFLAGIRGRRKAAVWFTEGIDLDPQDSLQGGFSTQIQDEMRDVIGAATRAGVSFYAVDARGVGAGLDEAIDIGPLPVEDATGKFGPSALINETRRAQDFMRAVSTETGGFAVVSTNNLNDAFARIIQENSSFYLLG
jgi:VWFA-related protein